MLCFIMWRPACWSWFFELHCTHRLLRFVSDCNKEGYYYYYYYILYTDLDPTIHWLTSFCVWMLLTGQHEGHLPIKVTIQWIPKVYLRDHLITWSNFGLYWLNKNQKKRVHVYVLQTLLEQWIIPNWAMLLQQCEKNLCHFFVEDSVATPVQW